MNRKLRILLFMAALISLVSGLLTGLARLGVSVPMQVQAGNHGAFMICGLFGTLISLERSIAMARPWVYLAPTASALGSLVLLSGVSDSAAAGLFSIAALLLVLASVVLWRKQPCVHLAVLGLGAVMWLIGNLVWIKSGLIMLAVPPWQSFLILTIAAERLELSRFVPVPALARRAFLLIVTAMSLGALLLATQARLGVVLFSVSLLTLMIWLMRYDIVRHTLRQKGLPRYIATCLSSGYIWLGVSALIMLAGEFVLASPLRDAALHAMLLGFVVAMVFGHAPIVLPAVTRLRLSYHRALYIPLLFLNASLLLRIFAGVVNDFELKQRAAEGNVISLLLFATIAVFLIIRQRQA
ncbi:MAG TPA: hypothetical protein VL381_09480 [Rhodocyclaceae bacterium]|nr:hypothetical protein [Rhodocyclaceae bacterium]